MLRVNRAVVGLMGCVLLAGCGTTRNTPPQAQVASDTPVRRSHGEVRESLRTTAKETLQTAATSRDPLIRMHALEAIKDSMGAAGAKEILAALRDPEPTVRFAAAMAAGELRLVHAMPTLQKLLKNDQNPHVQMGVVFAMHRLGETQYSVKLEEALKSRQPDVRADAAFVLGRLGEKSAVKILRPALRDAAVETRLQAAEAMWRLGDEEGLKYLVASSISGHPAHQMVGILGLAGPRDTNVIEHVRTGLNSDYIEVALVSARALGLLGSDEAYAKAVEATRSTDIRQRYLAALALGAIARADAQDVLEPMLNDAEADVRVAAAAAILELR
ncbi:MAG TPA: HEAT repeat domain-containing protein [Tepidisphaeraceae bacterium]|nr:HEAT repeat domain-containing protein [Tepidisphaeraceae bacterium]